MLKKRVADGTPRRKRGGLRYLLASAALFAAYAALYPKIAERLNYWISDVFFKRR